MTRSGQDEPRWRKSSHSGGGNDCVEVAAGPVTTVRDSKNPDGPRLRFAGPSWTLFLGSHSR